MKKVDDIYESTDYDKFTLLLGNRSVNDAHVKEIIELITTNGNLKIPIIVNEKYEIIDGQHRYFAWFTLKLPITFQIKPGLGLTEAQAMNYTNKNWTENDFLQSYIKHGIDAYVQYNKYKETFGLGHSVNIILLTGANDYRKQLHLFKSGEFKIKRLVNVIPFQLPAKVEFIEKQLMGTDRYPSQTKKDKTRAQAERTAWKLIYEWVHIQASLIEMKQAEFLEVFLPYVYNQNEQRTLFEGIKANNYKALLN